MPAINSTFLADKHKDVPKLCGLAQLPVKASKTPAVEPAAASDLPEFASIVDEALYLFRVNVFFRNFELKGPADRTLLYALLFIQECLAQVAGSRPMWSRREAEKSLLTTASSSTFPIPGDAKFSLSTVFVAPASRAEADALRQYLTSLRVSVAEALLDRLYPDPQGPADKWWLSFSKRRFMNRTL